MPDGKFDINKNLVFTDVELECNTNRHMLVHNWKPRLKTALLHKPMITKMLNNYLPKSTM